LRHRPAPATRAPPGGPPPCTWSIESGTLPDGLSLSPGVGVGVISGIPTTVETANFTVQVTSSAGDSVTKPLSITVNPGTFVIWPSNPTPAIVDGGAPGSVQLGAQLRPRIPPTITRIRLYNSAAHTRPHVRRLRSLRG